MVQFCKNINIFPRSYYENFLWQGFWRGNVPALLMVMPYTAIQFTVLHKLKTFATGSSKTGTLRIVLMCTLYFTCALISIGLDTIKGMTTRTLYLFKTLGK